VLAHKARHRRLDQRCSPHALLSQRHAAALAEPGRSEHVLHQTLELPEIARPRRDVLADPRGVDLGIVHELERHPDARHGGAQLMRDIGQELALVAYEHLEPRRHVVEGTGQHADFIATPHAAAGRQVTGAELPCASGQDFERPAQAPGQRPRGER